MDSLHQQFRQNLTLLALAYLLRERIRSQREQLLLWQSNSSFKQAIAHQ